MLVEGELESRRNLYRRYKKLWKHRKSEEWSWRETKLRIRCIWLPAPPIISGDCSIIVPSSDFLGTSTPSTLFFPSLIFLWTCVCSISAFIPPSYPPSRSHHESRVVSLPHLIHPSSSLLTMRPTLVDYTSLPLCWIWLMWFWFLEYCPVVDLTVTRPKSPNLPISVA